MAKDAGGHGSEARGLAAASARNRAMFGANAGFRTVKPVTSNAEASQSLMSSLKSTQAPVHDSMYASGGRNGPETYPRADGSIHPNDPRVGSRDYDAMGHPRTDKSDYDDYSRDLSLRSRNGGIGSGGSRAVNSIRGSGRSFGAGLSVRGVTK